MAFPAEIVIVDGPEHDATQPVITDVLRLWSMPELQYERYLQEGVQTGRIIAWIRGLLYKLIFGKIDNKLSV